MQFKILGAWGIYLHKFHPTDFKLLLPECLWLINNLLLINSLCLNFLWFMKIKFNNEKCDSWNEYARFEKSLKATTRILIADMSALTVLVSDLVRTQLLLWSWSVLWSSCSRLKSHQVRCKKCHEPKDLISVVHEPSNWDKS